MTQVSTAATDLKPARYRRPVSGSRREGAAAVQSPPNLKARPSMRDVLDAVERSHICTDELRTEVKRNHDEVTLELVKVADKVDVNHAAAIDKIHEVALKVAALEGAQGATNKALGVTVNLDADPDTPPAKTKTPFGLLSTPKAVLSVIAAVAGAGAGIKLLVAVGPSIWGVGIAVLHFWLGVPA